MPDSTAALSETEHLAACILCDRTDIRPYDTALSLWRCAHCGHIFDNPRPTTDAVSAYYSSRGKYDRWEPLREQIARLSSRRLARIRKHKRQGALLDVGAGTGQFLYDSRDEFTGTGAEVSAEAVRVARERFGIDLHHGTLGSVDLGGDRFDVITMSQVLEHVPWPSHTLRRCRELLAPGGILYISVPNEAAYSLRRVVPSVLGKLGVRRFRPFSRRGFRRLDLAEVSEVHVSHFSERILRRGLHEHGFRTIASGVDYHDALMFSSGLRRLAREFIVWCAAGVWALTRLNIYNCLWVIAAVDDAAAPKPQPTEGA